MEIKMEFFKFQQRIEKSMSIPTEINGENV